MAISKDKKRLEISLPSKQADWLKKLCKSRGITISKYISMILFYKAEELIKVLKFMPEDEEMLEQLIKIIKTPWIED